MPDTTDYGCILCPDPERARLPHRPPVCDACRSWLAGLLGDIRIRFEELVADADDLADSRTVPKMEWVRTVPNPAGPPRLLPIGQWTRRPVADADGQPATRPADPVSHATPAGLVPGPPGGPRSRTVPESRPPVALDPIDLAAPARAGTVHERDRAPMIHTRQVEILVRRVEVITREHEERNEAGEEVTIRERIPVTVEEIELRTERVLVHDEHGQPVLATPQDQVGHQPVATVLDQWVRDWIPLRARGEHLPGPTVDALSRWLADRVDWACDQHPAVDEFAAEMRQVRSALLGVLGLSDRPEYLAGVPCKKCDLRALYRRNGSEWVECGNCPHLLSPTECADWIAQAATESPSAVQAQADRTANPEAAELD